MAGWDRVRAAGQFPLPRHRRANLLWARPEASEGQLWEALDVAAAGFVRRLPQGLDTVLGDRGVAPVGGERQRVALARALVRRPALLGLDEATAASIPENERRVQDAIEQLHGHLTMVVITHRLTTVRFADVIHVLEGGRLVEFGRLARARERVRRPFPGSHNSGTREARLHSPRRMESTARLIRSGSVPATTWFPARR